MIGNRGGRPEGIFSAEGYTYVPTFNSFYKLHRIKSSWTEAVAACKSVGATLFYPKNKAEAVNVTEMLDIWNVPKPIVWIGISDLEEHGVYKTIDGLDISEVYNKWQVGEPNCGTDHSLGCVYLYKYSSDPELVVHQCGFRRPFICKLNNKEKVEKSADETFGNFVTEQLKKLSDEEKKDKISEIRRIPVNDRTEDLSSSSKKLHTQ